MSNEKTTDSVVENKPKYFNLVVIEDHRGNFYKASFQGMPISEKELFERILKTENTGFRISHYIDAFAKVNRNFNVSMSELNVS
jgi:hypothetical protein